MTLEKDVTCHILLRKELTIEQTLEPLMVVCVHIGAEPQADITPAKPCFQQSNFSPVEPQQQHMLASIQHGCSGVK